MDAEKYFTDNEPHDPNSLIMGQRVSKGRCIQLMEEYHKELIKCRHYWEEGYTMEPIIYCKKCDIELSDLIGSSAYDYKTREGKLIPVIFADQKHHL